MAEEKTVSKTTIKRQAWCNMIVEDFGAQQVPKKEVIDWLKLFGHKLKAKDTIEILKTYFDVQVGDIVVTHSDLVTGIPSCADCIVITGGNKHRRFTLQNIGQENGSVYIEIAEGSSDDHRYIGENALSGIFWFFLHEKFYTMRKICKSTTESNSL